MSSPKVAIIIHFMYGHCQHLSRVVSSPLADRGGAAIYQIAETLHEEVLAKMHAPAKPSYQHHKRTCLPVMAFSPLSEKLFGTELVDRFHRHPRRRANMSEVCGGSPWGAGTFAGPDGSRQPSALCTWKQCSRSPCVSKYKRIHGTCGDFIMNTCVKIKIKIDVKDN
ncbi:hypothetical protein P692DRAFT_201053000 [Suillus brevipes Sb2]|nr:hypothetical protein P692DRAFT_201053000 [Suillus brevipes Sb2]